MCSLGFLCASYIPRLKAKEAKNLERPMGADKKTSQQKPTLCSNRNGEGAAFEDRKLLDNNHSTTAKQHSKIGGPIPTQVSKGYEEARFHPSQGSNEAPNLLFLLFLTGLVLETA